MSQSVFRISLNFDIDFYEDVTGHIGKISLDPPTTRPLFVFGPVEIYRGYRGDRQQDFSWWDRHPNLHVKKMTKHRDFWRIQWSNMYSMMWKKDRFATETIVVLSLNGILLASMPHFWDPYLGPFFSLRQWQEPAGRLGAPVGCSEMMGNPSKFGGHPA